LERALVNAERGINKNGTIKITGEEKKLGNAQELIMRPRATLGTASGMCFFLVMKQIGATNWKPVYKSEIKPFANGAFEWNILNLLTTDIVNEGNIDTEFKIEFFQSQKSGKHNNMGNVNLSLAQVSSGQTEFLIVNRKGQTEPSRMLRFAQFELKTRFSFLDFIFGGCEIGLSIAVDFTLSNGAPSSP
jgi:vacuolar-type H+-ATPase subunit F/Vma7